MRGFVLGGTNSGVGKTVATLVVARTLDDAGYDVQPAKAGPDFIDPSHHRAVTDTPSRTLDCWLEGTDGLRRNYHRGDGDICVVEGVMGLYDGDKSSTAMVAEALDLPVVLVIDAKAGMESVAATALGFKEYTDRIGQDIEVAGVLAQRAHGGRHENGIREAIPEEMAYFGRIPPSEDLEIPDRHLGLEMGTETPLPEDALDDAAASIRTERLVALAETPPPPESALSPRASVCEPTVAVARDSAFAFVYPAVMERLRTIGTVETFSPVAGDSLPDADAIYLPGGYPELYLDALDDNPTLSAIAEHAAAGVPVFGECGGLMALCETLTGVDGVTASMAGVLPATVEMYDRYQALDHVELRARERTPIADADERVRGHEFHYSTVTVDGDARLAFDVVRGDGITDGMDGLTEYRTIGTYCHSHAAAPTFDTLARRAATSVV